MLLAAWINLPDFPLLNLSFWFLLISVSSYSVIVFLCLSFLCISLYASSAAHRFVGTYFWLTWSVKSLSFVFIFPHICSLVCPEVINFQLSLSSPSNLACGRIDTIILYGHAQFILISKQFYN